MLCLRPKSISSRALRASLATGCLPGEEKPGLHRRARGRRLSLTRREEGGGASPSSSREWHGEVCPTYEVTDPGLENHGLGGVSGGEASIIAQGRTPTKGKSLATSEGF